MMIAKECGYELGEFSHTIIDAHIYVNHIEGLKEQLEREEYPLHRIEINDKPFDKLTFSDIRLIGYKSHPVIKFDVAV